MQSDNIHGELSAGLTLRGSLNNNTARMSGQLHEGFGGTSDYNELENKPSINGVTLEGNVDGYDIGILPTVNYSLNEQDTFIKWIDGNDIFCRTVTGNFTTGTVTILSVTPSLGNIIKMEGFLYYAPNNQWLAIPYGENGDCVSLLTQNNDIKLYSTSTMSAYSRYIVTVYYTKGD